MTEGTFQRLAQSRCWASSGITDDVEDARWVQSGAQWANIIIRNDGRFRRWDAVEKSEGGGVCKHFSSSISMSSHSNVYRRLVAATSRSQELLKGLIIIPFLIIRGHIFELQLMKRNLRSIGPIGYVCTAYFLTLPLNASRTAKKRAMNVSGLLGITKVLTIHSWWSPALSGNDRNTTKVPITGNDHLVPALTCWKQRYFSRTLNVATKP